MVELNMVKKSIFTAFLALSIAVAFSLPAYAAEAPARYLVKSTNPFIKNTFNARHSFVNGFSADLTDWQLKLAKLFNIEVEPIQVLFVLPENAVTPAKESGRVLKGKNQRYLPSDQTPWGVEAVYQDGTLQKTSGGKDVKVAILDSGILTAHPDLSSRVKECKDFLGTRQPIIDGKCEDKNGHGTHVAGIIAANGGTDGLGIYGIAPEADLMVYKVCSTNGFCYADDIAVAIKIAADNGANIVNMSFGSDSPSALIGDAVSYANGKNVLMVAAAGNDGPYFDSIDFPAAFQSVAGVGAFDVFGNVAEWSSQGINSTTEPYVKNERDIEFAMPGVNIESTWKNGGYAILSGTSMSSPFLAGLAAKYWQTPVDGSLVTASDATRELLRSIAKDINLPGDDNGSGWGFPRVIP